MQNQNVDDIILGWKYIFAPQFKFVSEKDTYIYSYIVKA